ncbi:MAG: Type 1 glutamine amidotransferase-like domain-containing protein [Candidatus Paceibacterota bacterium]|jgi:dipeptidase E
MDDMSHIILTSTGIGSDYAKAEILKLVANPQDKRVFILTTAAKGKEANKYSILARQQFVEMGFVHVSFIDLEIQSAASLMHCDILYVCGGNTFHLMYYVRKSGADIGIRALLQNSDFIYIGVSAGSIILGKSIEIASAVDPDPNEIGLSDYRGMDIINADVSPHYEPGHEVEIKRYESGKGYPVIRLLDGEIKKVGQ